MRCLAGRATMRTRRGSGRLQLLAVDRQASDRPGAYSLKVQAANAAAAPTEAPKAGHPAAVNAMATSTNPPRIAYWVPRFTRRAPSSSC